MNIKQTQQAIDTPIMHSLVNSYLLQKAYTDITRAEVDKMYNQLLQDIPTYCTSKWRKMGVEGIDRITDHNKLYLAGDAECEVIYTEADKRLKEAGIKPVDMERDYCPALVAEDELRKIARMIADESCAPLGISADKLLCSKDGLENYKKWIELVVGAIVNSPKYKKPAGWDYLTA